MSVLVRYSSVQLLLGVLLPLLSIGLFAKVKRSAQPINIIMKIGIQNEKDNKFYIIEIIIYYILIVSETIN